MIQSLLTFSNNHKKKDCKFITLFFNQQIKHQLYLLIFNYKHNHKERPIKNRTANVKQMLKTENKKAVKLINNLTFF